VVVGCYAHETPNVTTASGASLSGSPTFRKVINPKSSSGHRLRSDNGYSHSSDDGWKRRNGPPRGSHPSRGNGRRGNGRQTGSPTCGTTGTNHLHGRLPPGKWRHGLRSHLEESKHLERPMGWGQEAYDAECAAIARALHPDHTLGTVTIFTDAQAAICR